MTKIFSNDNISANEAIKGILKRIDQQLPMPEEKSKEQLFRERWTGQEDRIQKIVEAAKKKEDWTVHLKGLPYVDEIQPIAGEMHGRDLRGIWLPGVDLSNADLLNAKLNSARLAWSKLTGAKLSGADLTGASFLEADLSRVELFDAKLEGAFLQRANLRDADLFRADFSQSHLHGANLSGSDSREARFDGAVLHGTIFDRANLREASFKGAKLWQASLRDADLQDTDIQEATGLSARQLAGSDICNAKLSDDIHKSDVLKHVEEASQNARKIFLSVLLGCVYSWLTIATTTDLRLLTNSASSPLPIIGTEIPIVGFYVAAPLLLFGFYIYLHLCMQRLWEGLASLPAVFPDGRPLDERIYPWLVTGLVRTHFPRLKIERPVLYLLQERISIVLAWWVVPLTMLFFWWRYLYRHDWLWTCLHILLLGLSILFGFAFYRLTVRTLSGEKLVPPPAQAALVPGFSSEGGFRLKHRISNIVMWLRHLREELQGILSMSKYTLAHRAGIFLAVFLFLSFWAISGIPFGGSWARADLYEADVSTKPANWTGKEIELVRGANLKGAKLNYCSAYRAFLVYADLREADLNHANLEWAEIIRAKLALANLSGARLMGADLRGAHLGGANLTKAKLFAADFRGADLYGAEFRGAELAIADLRGANLSNADLSGADLRGADLRGANLSNADLSGADLEGYIGKLDKKVHRTDLRNVVGLTKKQVESARINKYTRLPKDLELVQKNILKKQRDRQLFPDQ